MSTRVKLVGLLAIPVIALVAIAFAFGFGNSTTGTPTVEAVHVANGTGGELTLVVKDGDKTCIDSADTSAGIVCVAAGSQFKLSTFITDAPVDGYFGVQTYYSWTNNDINVDEDLIVKFPPTLDWSACNTSQVTDSNDDDGDGVIDQVNAGCLHAKNPAVGNNTLEEVNVENENAFGWEFQCGAAGVDSTTKVFMVANNSTQAGTFGAGFKQAAGTIDLADSITIHCQVPPTPTVTNTPTETSTATPTNTPVSQPPFVKSPALQNLFLTRQGTKIPPVQCVDDTPGDDQVGEGGDDTAELSMGLGVPIAQLDPKGSGKVVDLGAFEFEVHYDAQKVCVEIQQAQASITMLCFIEDDVTKPVLEGVARIGCVTVGKKINIDGVWAMSLSALERTSNCLLVVQEAPIGAGIGGKGSFGVVGAGIDQDAGEPGVQDCEGGTLSTFGWAVLQPGFAPPIGFDNQTGEFIGVIPCDQDSIDAGLCTSDGLVLGTCNAAALAAVGQAPCDSETNPPEPRGFFQEPTTLGLVIAAKFVINGGSVFGDQAIVGTISGARIQRFALDLATIIVRPQPDVYSQAIPNQDNGVVVQLNNQKCAIADQQGHPIAHFSCGDADVTIRYLEGDVEPDCKVNSLDTQNIAFRWGASKGTLLFLDRFNLEPSGAQSDDDIDIKDLQVVYGRIGSTCANPHPPQPAINAKGASPDPDPDPPVP